ncbi:MAG: hypothetical protein K1X57_20620, partial [Gemmataceae bacterium]|nr:hypothetical protein [Gemmataceae bacterium]
MRTKRRFSPLTRWHRLESRDVPAVISWDGGGGNFNFHNPLNWNTDTVPGVADDAIISIAGSNTISVNSTLNIRSLNSNQLVQIANVAVVTVTAGTSLLTAGITVDPGSGIGATGPTTAMTVTGPTIIDGCNLAVTDGAKLSLPAAVSYSMQPLGYGARRSFIAYGTGSKLDLGNLVSITQGDDWSNTLEIDALSGVIDLHSLVAINDPNVGDTRGRSVRVSAQGFSSVVDLSGLTTFTDRDPNYADYYGIYEGRSALLASNSGKITVP